MMRIYNILKITFDERGDLTRVNGPFLTGSLDTEHQLMPIEELVCSVTLDDGDRHGVYYLVGGKSLTAGWALTAALYTAAVIHRARVKHSRVY